MSADTDFVTSEREALRQYADWYSSQGYRVSVEPSPRELPEFLRTLAPDLIAHRNGENIVVEIKTSSPTSFEQVRQLQGRRPFWIRQIRVNHLQLPAGAMLQCPRQSLDLFEARRRRGLDFDDDIFAIAMGDQIRRQRAQKFRQFSGGRFYRNLVALARIPVSILSDGFAFAGHEVGVGTHGILLWSGAGSART
jgi:hypothetical protein